MRTIVVAATLFALTGCGYYHWHKEGAGDNDFRQDSAACQQQAAQGKWQACMTSKGWAYTSWW